MRRNLLFLILTFLSSFSFAQKIYFGLPRSGTQLLIQDVVLINIPNHIDGRFMASNELDSLKNFIHSYKSLDFRLSVHVSKGSSQYCLDYSIFLARQLENFLDSDNLLIEGKGKSVPLCSNKESHLFSLIDSRIEILVEGKH